MSRHGGNVSEAEDRIGPPPSVESLDRMQFSCGDPIMEHILDECAVSSHNSLKDYIKHDD